MILEIIHLTKNERPIKGDMEKLSDICKITIPKIIESNMCIYVGIFEYICIGINPFVDACQFVTLYLLS